MTIPLSQGVALVFNFFFLLAVIMLLGMLSIVSVFNVIVNRTTIESLQWQRGKVGLIEL